MEKILPAPSPIVAVIRLLNNMELTAELAPGSRYLDPEVWAQMQPHEVILARRPFLTQYKQTEKGIAVGFHPLVILPFMREGQPFPFLRSQILYMIEPKDQSFVKEYLANSSGIMSISQAMGPTAGPLLKV